jgi:fatty-acid desaturase
MNNFFKQFIATYTLIPMHILGIYSIYTIAMGNAPEYWLLATLVGYILFKMLGVGACYHRMLSHRSFTVNKITKYFSLWCGGVSGQGSPLFWVTVHRGYHHRWSDTDKDLHSPKHGFWHSYFLWLYTTDFDKLNYKTSVDLLRDKDVMFFHKYYNSILLISHLGIALINFDFYLYFLLLPCLISFHSFAVQTSVVHYPKLGYRNYNTKDDSVNVPWLFPISTGECWHNNHHGNAKNPNFGGVRWFEIDPTYWLIKLIRKS